MSHRVVRGSLALAIVLAVVAAGCSKAKTPSQGPGGVAAAAYVSGVCGAVSEWQDAVKTLADGLTAQLQSAASLDAAKQELVSYVDQNVTAADTMITKVQAVGAPAVANGAHIQSEVIAALQQVRASFADAKSKAEQIDTSSPTTFSNGVTDVTNTLDQDLSNLGDPLAGVTNQDLENAANADATCQKIQNPA